MCTCVYVYMRKTSRLQRQSLASCDTDGSLATPALRRG